MSTAEEIDTEIKKTEAEISVTNRKRIEITTKLQQLNAKLDKLQKQYSSLKSKEVSNIDWASNTYEWKSKIQNILENKFNLKEFRHQQLSAINAVLSGKDIILLMPTGGGKSLCYQLPALFTKGITLVVSPLLALIDDQIIALRKLEIDAITLNSSNSKTESQKVYEVLKTGKSPLKLIYVTPEWMAKSKRFMSYLQKCYERKGLDRIAIDEVHCCSQWGHDFRPDYKFLGILKNIFPDIPIMGLTATATESIISDVQQMLNIQGCVVLRASYNRPNLYYEVRQKPSSQEQCFDLLEDLLTRKYKDQSGIIYTTTINDCGDIAKQLRDRGLSVASYHANMEAEVRQKVHRKWLSGYYQTVVATVAFGMGIDKPDVRFVIHHCLSKSVENFYQESGRAGRDNKRADCILLYSLKDVFRMSSMVSTTPSGSDNLYKLVEYCLDAAKCRRSLIATHFDETWNSAQCNKMCDHCKNSGIYDTVDITKHCKDIVTIIEYAEKSESRLTAVKLLDAWFKSGGSKLVRPPELTKPLINRELGEHIIAYLLIRRYLKEDIHFTPYNTISYINKGFKANLIDTITMNVPSRKRSTESIPPSSSASKKSRTDEIL